MAARLVQSDPISSRPAVDDREFAAQVAQRQPDAIIVFRNEFAHALDDGFAMMTAALARTQPPGCRSELEALVTHVAGASGEGYLKRAGDVAADPDQPQTHPALRLDEHVPSLALPDLFHASACLQHDAAACRRLVQMIDDEIGPPLVRRFHHRLAPGRCEQIVEDVLSQAWSSSRSSRPPVSARPDGAQPGDRPRLESYLGLSALKTWLYAIGFRMLQDEARSMRHRTRSLDDDDSTVAPVDRNDPPDLRAANRELVDRYRPRLESELAAALAALADRKSPRLAHVAYLWLPCRMPQHEIAEIVGVTRPRISQQVSEIRHYLSDATASTCRDLCEQSGVAAPSIVTALRENLEHFFPPVLRDALLDEFRLLQARQAQLLHLAYLAWHEKLPMHEMAEQLAEPPTRVAVLLDRLSVWRAEVQTRVAERLSAASGVPVELLVQAAQRTLDTGFSAETHDHSESNTE